MASVVNRQLACSMPFAALMTGFPAGTSSARDSQTCRRLCVGTASTNAPHGARSVSEAVAAMLSGRLTPGRRGASRVFWIAVTVASSRAQSTTFRPARAAASASAAPHDPAPTTPMVAKDFAALIRRA
jgi:hypothetical protein